MLSFILTLLYNQPMDMHAKPQDLIAHYETPERLHELDPSGTLKKLGLKKDSILCDIGAGTGIFTIPAAKISANTIYAIDVTDEMLSIIAGRVKSENLTNVQLIKPEGFSYPIPSGSCDIVLMCAVYHHIGCAELLHEIRRILKKDGKLALIEFYKKVTPYGPPVQNRISRQEIDELACKNGFAFKNESSFGENYYLAEYIPE